MIDWQTVTVALIVLVAAVYVARRGWTRLRSFRMAGGSPARPCGGCDEGQKTAEAPAKVLVQINRSNPTTARRNSR
jgi:hypothetical protein